MLIADCNVYFLVVESCKAGEYSLPVTHTFVYKKLLQLFIVCAHNACAHEHLFVHMHVTTRICRLKDNLWVFVFPFRHVGSNTGSLELMGTSFTHRAICLHLFFFSEKD